MQVVQETCSFVPGRHADMPKILCWALQGDAVEIYIMTKEGTKREVMPLKKD